MLKIEGSLCPRTASCSLLAPHVQLQLAHHHLLVKVLRDRLKVLARPQLDGAQLAHSDVPREARAALPLRPVIQIRIRRAQPRHLLRAKHKRLRRRRSTDELPRQEPQLVLSPFDTLVRKLDAS